MNREAELTAPTGVGSGDLLGGWYLISHLVNFGGFRDGHTKQNKPITPTKIMGIKSSQLMPPPTSNANPPTLPSHQKLEATGCESDIRATKNDKAATENIPNPSLRRLMLINVKPPNDPKLSHGHGESGDGSAQPKDSNAK